jgi:hypothetical protein
MAAQDVSSNGEQDLPQWGRRYNSDSKAESPWARKVILSLGMSRYCAVLRLFCDRAYADRSLYRRRRRRERLLFSAYLEGADERDQDNREGYASKLRKQYVMPMVSF